MRITIVGAGLVGRRVAHLLSRDPLHEVTLTAISRPLESIEGVVTATGWPSHVGERADVVILATESQRQVGLTKELLSAGTSVISTADDPDDVRRLWSFGALARSKRCSLVVGAAYSPGVSTLIASWLVQSFDDVSCIRLHALAQAVRDVLASITAQWGWALKKSGERRCNQCGRGLVEY